MVRLDAAGNELFACTNCKCWRLAAEYEVDRHGLRRKGCKPCKAKREASKCEHGKPKWDCSTCSPDKFCEHGKSKIRHTCSVCDAAGNIRRMHIRNAREFANQPGGWPYAHKCEGDLTTYNIIVNKWKAVFAKMLEDGDINADFHTQILANLSPWGKSENGGPA